MLKIAKAAKTEWITRAEAAARLDVSASMVSRYVKRGMPSRASDKRVPWPAAHTWHQNNILSWRSGSWYARQRRAEESEASAPIAAEVERSTETAREFTRGVKWAFARIRRQLREGMPEIMANMPKTAAKDGLTTWATIDYLIEGWCDVPDAETLIDWSKFRKLNPKEAQDVFEGTRRWFESEGADV